MIYVKYELLTNVFDKGDLQIICYYSRFASKKQLDKLRNGIKLHPFIGKVDSNKILTLDFYIVSDIEPVSASKVPTEIKTLLKQLFKKESN